jgi:hypothetical protein
MMEAGDDGPPRCLLVNPRQSWFAAHQRAFRNYVRAYREPHKPWLMRDAICLRKCDVSAVQRVGSLSGENSGCAYRKLTPSVAAMEAADHGFGKDPTKSLDWSGYRWVLL